APEPASPLKLTEETLPEVWGRVLAELPPFRANHLRGVGLPAIFGPNSLVIRVPAGYSAYDYCADDRAVELIRSALARVTGGEWVVRVEQVAGPANGPAASPAAPPAPADRRKDLLQLPLLKKAVDTLGAQLVNIDDGFIPT